MVAVKVALRFAAAALLSAWPIFAQSAATGTSDSKKIEQGIDSLRQTVWIGDAIVLILLWSCSLFIIFLLFSRLPGRAKTPPVASPQPLTTADLEPFVKRLEEQHRELTALGDELREGIAGLRRFTREAAAIQTVEPTLPNVTEPAVRALAAAAAAELAGNVSIASSEKEPEDGTITSLPEKEKFEDWYQRIAVQDGALDSVEPKPIIVFFKNSEALDRNPDRFEPLVKNNAGTLMLFSYDGLQKGEYYVAPLLAFKGVFTETHTRTWRSLFDFNHPRALKLVKAAIVRADGNEWTLVKKGGFA